MRDFKCLPSSEANPHTEGPATPLKYQNFSLKFYMTFIDVHGYRKNAIKDFLHLVKHPRIVITIIVHNSEDSTRDCWGDFAVENIGFRYLLKFCLIIV